MVLEAQQNGRGSDDVDDLVFDAGEWNRPNRNMNSDYLLA